MLIIFRYMLFVGQEVTQVYTRIGYEFNLSNQVIQRKQRRSIADFKRG